MIPLNDPRRRRNGNRTVRMSLATWQRLKHYDRHEKARGVCRVPLPLDWLAIHGREKPSMMTLTHNLIHHCGLGKPSEVRKNYGSIIRQMLCQAREARLLSRSRCQPHS